MSIVFSMKRWFFTFVPKGTPAYLVHREAKQTVIKPLKDGFNTYNLWTDRVIKLKPLYEIERHFQLNTEKCVEVDVTLQTKDPQKMCDLVVRNFEPVEDLVRGRVVANSGKLVQDVPAMSASEFELEVSDELRKHSDGWGVNVQKVEARVRDHEPYDTDAMLGYQRMY